MDNLRGSLFMVLAMACFSIEDAFIKAAAETVPLGQIIFVFGLFGTSLFILLTLRRGEIIFHPAILSRLTFIRSLCEIVGRLFFSISLVLIPLSSLSAILQATPLIVVMGAAIFFGEKVGWRRWSAILIGLIGVLMIIRPGLDGFEPASLFAVLGTLGFAGRDLATRAAPKVLSNMQLGVYGFFILMPTGILILLFNGEINSLVLPNSLASLQILGTIIFGFTAYYSLTVAMRIGEVSVITPFRYTRLIFALIIGVTLFGERPDTLTIVGSAIVILGGFYTLLRSRALNN
ncbi:MAG: DMT family transporter [Cocleimonas sp.]